MSYKNRDEEPPKTKARKNKRKWCRGKIGVEHQPKWVYRTHYVFTTIEYTCQVCGKVLDWGHVGRQFIKSLKEMQECGAEIIVWNLKEADISDLVLDVINKEHFKNHEISQRRQDRTVLQTPENG